MIGARWVCTPPAAKGHPLPVGRGGQGKRIQTTFSFSVESLHSWRLPSGLDRITQVIAVEVVDVKREEVARFVKIESAYKADAYVTRFTFHIEIVDNKHVSRFVSQTHFEFGSQEILIREAERVSQGVGGDAVDAVVNRKVVNAFDDLVLDDQVRITSEMQWIIDFRAVSQASETWNKFWDSNIERHF